MKGTLAMLTVLLALLPGRGATANPAWTIQPSTTLSNLYGVAHVDAGTWIAVGDGGTILRSTDGGAGWSGVSSPVADALRGVSMLGSVGVAVGIGGRIVRTTDGGAHWVVQVRPTTRALYAVSLAPGLAVATGEEGQIFVSEDDGVSWTLHTAGTASVLFGVSVNGSSGIGVGGQGAVVMSTNAGQGWGLTIPGDALTFFYGACLASPSTGWAVGTSVSVPSLIIKSTDTGFVWGPQTAPTAQTLTGVSCTSLDVGTAVGFAGTILRTEDGGAHWTSQDGNTAQNLNAVSFYDSQLGVAVGDLGTILRTTSGGTVDVTAAGTDPRFGFDPILPNPVHGAATIGFRIPEDGWVRLGVFDVSGAYVTTLIDGPLPAGRHSAVFHGQSLRSGLYFSRLELGVGGRRAVSRLVLVR